MARYARLEVPGAVHHLVSRFVNNDFRFTGPLERRNYLSRVPRALQRSDWDPLSYCLMSSHNHWAGLAGSLPSASFIKPLHVGTATWLNRTQGRFGPVFADRHRSIVCDPQHAALVIAYIHNNPVRAGLVGDPADSDWSSHRAYLGLVKAPPWLNVERGLSACGFDSSPKGRVAFHEFVVAHSRDPRCDEFSAAGMASRRARLREILGASVECAWPALEGAPGRSVSTVLAPRGVAPAWVGDPADVLRVAADQLGFDVAGLSSRVRPRRVTAQRRLLLHLWTIHLGRRQSEMARLLGLSAAGASKLLRAARADWASMNRACSVLETLLRRQK
jgi:hypothetical protein